MKNSSKAAGKWSEALAQVKWTLDYFVKCHVSKLELYVQVGDGEADHAFWGRAEEMTMNRSRERFFLVLLFLHVLIG